MSEVPQADITVDTFGLLCPMPIIKCGEAVRKMNVGEVVKVIATDPGAVADLKTWCKANRNTYIRDEINGRVFTIWISKGLADV